MTIDPRLEGLALDRDRRDGMTFVGLKRGDVRPCWRPACPGTMRFGLASENSAGREAEGIVKIVATSACPNPTGWICSEDAEHFRTADSRLLTLVPR